jgi:trimeric autotransporter adhesin
MIVGTHGLIASQISQFTGLLDLYPSAAAAYSLRKLRGGYTGSAIRVRRTNLDEMDIGFTSTGALDTAALLAFTGTGALDNGFVKTWYDQSGNARNATQTTAVNQPQIVSSGSVLTLTGTGSANPCMRFDAINDMFDLSTTIPISTGNSFSIYQVEKKTSSGSIGIWMTGGNTNGSPFGPVHYSNTNLFMNTQFNASSSGYRFGGTLAANYNLIAGYMKDSDITSDAYVNNTLYSFTNTTSESRLNAFSRIGARSAEFSGTSTQEMIVYLSNQSANNTAINTNINTYYGIY